MSRPIYLCDTCRWYGGFFAPDLAHLCNAPDDKGCCLDVRKTKCRHYKAKRKEGGR